MRLGVFGLNDMEICFGDCSTRSRGYCELTDEMDSYLLCGKSTISSIYRTYVMYEGDRKEWIYGSEEGEAFALRLPVATRGYFFTNAVGVIDTIEFYEDSCYVKLPAYDRKMESIKEKYLGRKVIIT